ncbi:MAG: baseplate J/gp47 family protein [Limnochordales bacterium]|nr:baseplate J/gp47 family protein [Limnochordales bacterium]
MAELPEYLTDQTEERIRQRMLDSLPSDLDKSEGSYIWDALAPTAAELAQAAIWAQEVLRRGFASTTFGPYLDLRCAEHGVERRPATPATGKVRFVGLPGVIIPAGTRVATPGDPVTRTPSVEFRTVADVTLDSAGQATVDVQATVPGASGNVGAGAITLVVDGTPGVASVTNPAPTTGGADAESDEALLARYFLKVRTPATSGNAAHYRMWALDIPGVGDAKVYPLWNGPGTVKVRVIDVNKKPASPELVAQVAAHIEEERPIGASVTVEPAKGVVVDVTATITLASGYVLNDVQQAFAAKLTEHFASLAFKQYYVSYAQVGALLLALPGVLDYSALALNGAAANVMMDEESVPVLGTVTLST